MQVLLTVLSLSAIATNGIVPSGGVYVILSRSFGAELGGVVGLLHYLSGTVVVGIYCLGVSEMLLRYLLPQATIFGEEQPPEAMKRYVDSVRNDLLASGCQAQTLTALLASITPPSVTLTAPLYNNYRVYGLCCLVFLFCCVFLGNKLINRVTFVALGCILVVLASVLVGLLVHSAADSQRQQRYDHFFPFIY